jgi:hypothetical protein
MRHKYRWKPRHYSTKKSDGERKKLDSPSSLSSLPAKNDWVDKPQELLLEFINSVQRAAGSIIYGFVAMFVKSPLMFLQKHYLEGRVLPWGTLLLAVSILAGALFISELSYSGDKSKWLESLAGVMHPADYLDRVLAIALMGLLTCFFARVLFLFVRRRGDTAGVELAASTFFSVTVFALILEVITADLLNKYLAKEPSWIHFRPEDVGYLIFRFPISVGFAFIVVRTFYFPISYLAVPLLVKRIIKVVLFAPFAFIGFLIPSFVATGLSYAFELSPALTDYLNPELVSDPWESAGFVPYQMECDTQRNDGGNRNMICKMYGRTSGKGQVLLDINNVVMFGSEKPIRPGRRERYRFSESNWISRHGYPYETENLLVGFYKLAQLKISGASSPQEIIIVELGKPLLLELSFDLEHVCSDERIKTFFHETKDASHLYIRVRPLRTREISKLSDEYAALGPWDLQSFRGALKRGCNPELRDVTD